MPVEVLRKCVDYIKKTDKYLPFKDLGHTCLSEHRPKNCSPVVWDKLKIAHSKGLIKDCSQENVSMAAKIWPKITIVLPPILLHIVDGLSHL